jgi:hypothetical protein
MKLFDGLMLVSCSLVPLIAYHERAKLEFCYREVEPPRIESSNDCLIWEEVLEVDQKDQVWVASRMTKEMLGFAVKRGLDVETVEMSLGPVDWQSRLPMRIKVMACRIEK